MNVLLIEDNQYKADQLEKFIKDEFPEIILTIKGSYNSGLREIVLNNDIYKFILLDISMPTYDIKQGESGGEPIPLAGKYLLKELYLRDIDIKVIVVTMYENFVDGSKLKNLDIQLRQEFSSNYCGYVYFSPGETSWKKVLKDSILNVI